MIYNTDLHETDIFWGFPCYLILQHNTRVTKIDISEFFFGLFYRQYSIIFPTEKKLIVSFFPSPQKKNPK